MTLILFTEQIVTTSCNETKIAEIIIEKISEKELMTSQDIAEF